MRFLLLVPLLLIVGYVVARNHHRLRNLGIGAVVGSDVPPLPGVSNHDGHGHGHQDGGHGHVHHDHISSSDSVHVDTGGHGH